MQNAVHKRAKGALMKLELQAYLLCTEAQMPKCLVFGKELQVC